MTWSFSYNVTHIHTREVPQVFLFPPFHSNARSGTAVGIRIEQSVRVPPDGAWGRTLPCGKAPVRGVSPLPCPADTRRVH